MTLSDSILTPSQSQHGRHGDHLTTLLASGTISYVSSLKVTKEAAISFIIIFYFYAVHKFQTLTWSLRLFQASSCIVLSDTHSHETQLRYKQRARKVDTERQARVFTQKALQRQLYKKAPSEVSVQSRDARATLIYSLVTNCLTCYVTPRRGFLLKTRSQKCREPIRSQRSDLKLPARKVPKTHHRHKLRVSPRSPASDRRTARLTTSRSVKRR